jgi:hypothetical protein
MRKLRYTRADGDPELWLECNSLDGFVGVVPRFVEGYEAVGIEYQVDTPAIVVCEPADKYPQVVTLQRLWFVLSPATLKEGTDYA